MKADLTEWGNDAMSYGTYIAQEKVKLFISSGMSSHSLRDIRNTINDLLTDSPYVEGWLFEHAGASSLNAEVDYRMRVADADVCAFIIDGRCEIPIGVQKEIDEASRRNKKCFYYLFRVSHEGPRKLREGLRGPDKPKYYEPKRICDIPEQIQKDVVEEIFFCYRSYARGVAELSLESMGAPSMQMAQDVFVSKTALSGYPACETVLNGFLYDSGHMYEASDGLDDAIASFLDVMCGYSPVTSFRISSLLDALKQCLPEAYYPTIELRWQAIQQYFLGDLNRAFEFEKKALGCAGEANLPTWFVDDIRIDLRNLEVETDRMQNIIFRHGSYQQEIEEQGREIQLPLVDRLTENLLESIASEELKKRVQSAYTITFGSPSDKWVGMLVKLFVAIVHYGSLTHVRLFYGRMRLVASCLWRIAEDRSNLTTELKLATVTNTAKELRGFMTNNSCLLGEMTCYEADSVLRFAWDGAFGCGRDDAKVAALASLAAFLSETEFERALADSKSLCYDLLAHAAIPPRELHKMLSECYSRSGDEWVIDVAIAALEKGPGTHWAKEALDFLSEGIPESFCEDGARVNSLLSLLGEHALDMNADKGTIVDAIAGVRALPVRQTSWFASFEEGLSEYYKMRLWLGLDGNDDARISSLLKESLSSIRVDNSSQGVGGQWVQSGIDHYRRIEVFLEGRDVPDPAFVKECAYAAVETLLAPRQTTRAKWGACLLLLSLVGYDAGLLHDEQLSEELGDADGCSVADLPVDLLGLRGPDIIRVALVAVRELFGMTQKGRLHYALLDKYRAEAGTLANLCVLLGHLVGERLWETVPLDILSSSVDFLLAMVGHENNTVRRNALLAIAPMTRHPTYCRPVCAVLARVFASSHPSSKHAILNALRDGGAFTPDERSHILQVASASACYYVNRRVVDGKLVS